MPLPVAGERKLGKVPSENRLLNQKCGEGRADASGGGSAEVTACRTKRGLGSRVLESA